MLVRTQNKGREVLGLLVGINNARRYFSKEATTVDLELDHLQIQCDLGPEFWTSHPEILDSRLSAWLEQKNLRGESGSAPVPLAMIPSGKNAFRLQPLKIRTRNNSGHTLPAPPFDAA